MDYSQRNARIGRMFKTGSTAKVVAKKMRMSLSNANRIKKELGLVKARKSRRTRKTRYLAR